MSRKITEDFIGTCPCCFGEFKVKPNGDSCFLVDHGFKRPGDGYQTAGCPGFRQQPFEHSPEATKDMISSLLDEAERLLQRVARIEADEKIELKRREERYDRGRREYVQEMVIYKPGDPGYGNIRYVLLRNLKRDARWHQETADYFQKRVDSWERKAIVGVDVPATGRERDLKGSYDPFAEPKAPKVEKPGKLRLEVFWVEAGYVEYADREKTYAGNKAYVRDALPPLGITGKLRLSKGWFDDYNYRRFCKEFDESEISEKVWPGSVVVTGIDWALRDELTNLPYARVIKKSKKDITVQTPLSEIERMLGDLSEGPVEAHQDDENGMRP